jgi:hypothetical protein
VSTTVAILVTFAVLAVTLVALEWIRAWREVRLAQAKRPTGPGKPEPGDCTCSGGCWVALTGKPVRDGVLRCRLGNVTAASSVPGHDDGTLGG